MTLNIVSATIIIRGFKFEEYSLPDDVAFHNIFHRKIDINVLKFKSIRPNCLSFRARHGRKIQTSTASCVKSQKLRNPYVAHEPS